MKTAQPTFIYDPHHEGYPQACERGAFVNDATWFCFGILAGLNAREFLIIASFGLLAALVVGGVSYLFFRGDKEIGVE